MASPFAVEPLTPERRREMTREHLLRAAAQVFTERGFHSATLDEVAAVAGFTKGAVYSNFRNKEDLFLAVLGWIYDQEMDALRQTLRSSETPSESRLSDFADLVRRQGVAAGADWSVLYEEFHLYALRNAAAREKLAELDRQDIEEVARVIEEERKRLGFRPLESATDAARIVIALMRGVGMMRCLDPELANDEQFLPTVMAFMARGLLTAPEA
jgi:AcrR family transcriptional regulator